MELENFAYTSCTLSKVQATRLVGKTKTKEKKRFEKIFKAIAIFSQDLILKTLRIVL